jgi:hypothetical protein
MVNGCAWFTPKMVWTLHSAWPTKAIGTDLKSEGQRVAVESVDIAVETLEVKAVYVIFCPHSARNLEGSRFRRVDPSYYEPAEASRFFEPNQLTHAAG